MADTIPEHWRETLKRAAKQDGVSYTDFLARYIVGRNQDSHRQLAALTYLRPLIGDVPLNTSQEFEAAAQKIIDLQPQSWRTKSEELQSLAASQAQTEALERELEAARLMPD